MQEIAAVLAVLAAVAYLAARWRRRRAARTCCGKDVCPAAKRVVDELARR